MLTGVILAGFISYLMVQFIMGGRLRDFSGQTSE